MKIEGVTLLRNYLSKETQESMIASLRKVMREAPLFTPTMADGRKFRYQMTNCGVYGWLADTQGYRYTREDPRTSKPWPEMPEIISSAAINAAASVGELNYRPETCLINFYANEKERLGIHQDNTEKNLTAAIVSFSLGDSGVFQIGGFNRSDPTQDMLLHRGDCLIMHGVGRMRYHALKQIIAGSGDLPKGGRINLTVRTVE